MVSLVAHDEQHDEHEHVEDAELELLRARCGQNAEAELGRREALLEDLVRRRRRTIPDVRAALAEYRGERTRLEMRGDPTV